ncbi:hypothetical protein ACIOD0_32995 [Kitasatospora albolonga]|uniref:hypothetical protein n=1 Tax=Streptomyces sp. NPDC012600 TaxID=3415005 RepID=UPI00380119B2
MTHRGQECAGARPLGRWNAEVERRGRWTASVFHFAADGTALLLEGGPGEGRWTDLGAGRFAFRVVEPLYGDDGRGTGRVVIEQTAVLAGPSFTSTGLSTVHDDRGRVVRRLPVRITATAAE